ncbi:MAG: glycerol acyltransferase, partial [Candidatus Limisoma sp.]
DCQMIMFPAGLCSRMGEGGRIADLEWQKSFISKSREYHRDIIPVYFGGLNSKFFYKFAKLRRRMGIKLNIEMVRLPAELVRGAGGTFNVVFGEPISYATFDNSKTPQEWAQEVKRTVYGLADELK